MAEFICSKIGEASYIPEIVSRLKTAVSQKNALIWNKHLRL